VELIDLYPTVAGLCGLEVPARLQGEDLSRMFDDPSYRVRDSAFCVAPFSRGFLLRDDRWAFIQYAEDASKGIELFDMVNDPGQYTNLAGKPEFAPVVAGFRARLATRRAEVQDNDLRLIRDSGVLQGDRSATPATPCPASGCYARTRRTPNTAAASPARPLGADEAMTAAMTRTLPAC